jgi:predicted DCC family thiol-disulfide oxidoreductase YuxK
MAEQPLILFDGVCNLCNGVVRFVIRQDKKGALQFAPLQSAAAQKLLQQMHLPQKDFETFLLIENGKVFQKSSAALQVAKHFKWYWQWLQVFWMVPKPVRDAAYGFVAQHRYQWFGKKDTCMLPDAKLKNRFIEH